MPSFMLAKISLLGEKSSAELTLVWFYALVHSDMVKQIPSFGEYFISVIVFALVSVGVLLLFLVENCVTNVFVGLKEVIVHVVLSKSEDLDSLFPVELFFMDFIHLDRILF